VEGDIEAVTVVLWKNQIYPALFVIRYKSLNRSKTIKGANLWLWPTRLDWKSKTARRVPHIV
jgi:hypothetical protein